MGKLEYVVTIGKLLGKSGTGRSNHQTLDSLASRHGGTSMSEIIACARDRRLWTSMVSDAIRHHLKAETPQSSAGSKPDAAARFFPSSIVAVPF